MQAFNNLDVSTGKIFSKVDQFETEITNDIADIDVSLGKIFSEIDIIDSKLVVGVNALHEKLRVMEPNSDPLLISQQTIGDGDSFIITGPGYYRLTESVTFTAGAAIVIQANNVVLDLSGMIIDGSAAANGTCIIAYSIHGLTIKNGSCVGAYGIVLNDVQDVILQDLVGISNNQAAIACTNVHQATIQNCIISNVVNGSGLTLDQLSSEIIIKNCSATGCTQYGYQLAGVDIALINSIAQANGTGILCSNINKVQVIGNNVEGNTNDGIDIDATAEYVHAISNRILGNGGIGLNNLASTALVCLNNLSTGNNTDYVGVKAVAIAKATSYWCNVQG
jgi:hypothetical protein